MERIKLTEPGSELTLAVTNVTREELGGGNYYKCDDGKTELLVPVASADRQFEHIGITSAGGMVGKTIRFSRSEKASKSGHPYWNLDLAAQSRADERPFNPHSEAIAASAALAKNAALPEGLRDEELRDEDTRPWSKDKVPVRVAYKGLTEWVLKEIAPLYAEAGIGMSPESAAAAVATLFIAANQRGKLE